MLSWSCGLSKDPVSSWNLEQRGESGVYLGRCSPMWCATSALVRLMHPLGTLKGSCYPCGTSTRWRISTRMSKHKHRSKPSALKLDCVQHFRAMLGQAIEQGFPILQWHSDPYCLWAGWLNSSYLSDLERCGRLTGIRRAFLPLDLEGPQPPQLLHRDSIPSILTTPNLDHFSEPTASHHASPETPSCASRTCRVWNLGGSGGKQWHEVSFNCCPDL